MPKTSPTPQTSWLDKPLFSSFKLNWEIGVVALLLIAAIVTRFYGLGDRVMSHDETTHVYFSWQLFKGNGYSHDPLSHGPLQFHLIALSYFLFGDNDFTARVPVAVFGVLTIWFVWWGFRRYIGRIGALAAALFFLISPYLLYYGRYARNESWVALFGLVMLWGILRYLDTSENKYLYVTTAAIALHFTAKETSFIYLAQILLFLGFLFLYRIGKIKWAKPERSQYFYMLLLVAGSLLVFALSAQASSHQTPAATDVPSTEVQEPATQGETEAAPASSIGLIPAILGGLAVVAVGASIYFLVTGFGWQRLRKERSFGVMLLIFTLALPHLAAFPIEWLRPDLNYTALKGIILNWANGVQLAPTDVNAIILTFACLIFLFLVSAALGLLWSPKVWAINFAIFFAIYIPLYTTMFTNGAGMFTGLVGSLGYWLEQQGVERGSQPWYFYALVQVPLYEFLALFGTMVAAFIGFRYWRHLIPVFLLIIIWPFFTFGLFVFIGFWAIPFAALVGIFLGRLILSRWPQSKPLPDSVEANLKPEDSRHLALVLISFWAITSLVAYTVAGEKMPWLTVHIALPLLLLAGWAAGWIVKRVDWPRLMTLRSLFAVFAAIVFIVSLVSALGSLLGTHPPFAGSTQLQLQDTYRFVFYALLAIVSAYEMLALPDQAQWKPGQVTKVFVLLIFGGLAFFGARTAFRANYINYDYATEYLVYAHMAPGPKEIMTQVEELSKRLTDSNDIQIAYDNETTYPFWWYLRNYPNQRYYADQPTRDLREFPVILVGDANYGKIEPIVGDSYYMYEYNRIWWPNQDYFEYGHDSVGASYAAETGLPASDMPAFEYLSRVGNRLWSYFGNPQYREAIWQIWMNRDFRPYLEAKGQDPSLAKWVPSRTMRMYIRKDIAAQIWDYGIPPAAETVSEDPYLGKGIELGADIIIGSAGTEPGQFNSPRGVALAPDGSVYVADSLNHRIQHFGADGVFINEWGTPSDPNSTELRGGTFNEPWGVAVSPDGAFVYVADTWNHRIQKFTSSGIFLKAWGNFGQDDQPYSMWGPRDILVDNDGNVLVMDTGNKRIKVFDADGNFISQFGTVGLELGQFDEPVGMALDRQLGRLYIADTWNQRVQVLDYSGGNFQAIESWDISGWYGQSLVNKPYLSVGAGNRVLVTDPESGRILVFESDGTFAYFFGGYEQTAVEIGIAQGISADAAGGVWVSDSQNNTLLHFTAQ